MDSVITLLNKGHGRAYEMTSTKATIVGVYLLLGAVMTACSSNQSPKNSTNYHHIVDSTPYVEKIYAQEDDLVLFSGGKAFPEGLVSDGQLYLLDRDSGNIHLLTPPKILGEAFFASGGTIAPGGKNAYISINVDGKGQGLYKVELETGNIELLTTAEQLNLSDILEWSFTVSPDGQTLAFSAYAAANSSAKGDNQVQLLGVYTIDVSMPQKSESLRLVQQEELSGKGLGQVLTPHFGPGGKLTVDAAQRPKNPRPEKPGPALSPSELKQLSPKEIEDLRLKPLGTDGLSPLATSHLRIPYNGFRHITQGYGDGNHSGSIYYALDFNLSGTADCGTLNRAALGGVVQEATYRSDLGNFVRIRHPDSYTTYAHMQSLSVRTGASISAGTVIGRTGATGTKVTGCHLHFVWLNGGRTASLEPATSSRPMAGIGPSRCPNGSGRSPITSFRNANSSTCYGHPF